jgi:hypothetical protein
VDAPQAMGPDCLAWCPACPSGVASATLRHARPHPLLPDAGPKGRPLGRVASRA